MHPSFRGVSFLLSLGALPIACNDKDPTGTPGTTDTGLPPLTDPGGTDTTVDPTGGPDDTTTTTVSTSSMSTSTDPSLPTVVTTFLTSDTTVGDTGQTDDDTGPDIPPPENPVCQAHVEHYTECFPRYARYAAYAGYYCDTYIKMGLRLDGQACADAFEAYFACLNQLPCDEWEGGDPDSLCAPEIQAAEAACPNIFDGGETDTGDTFGDTGSSSG